MGEREFHVIVVEQRMRHQRATLGRRRTQDRRITGERRLGSHPVPQERRGGSDRRSGLERRSGGNRRRTRDRRSGWSPLSVEGFALRTVTQRDIYRIDGGGDRIAMS